MICYLLTSLLKLFLSQETKNKHFISAIKRRADIGILLCWIYVGADIHAHDDFALRYSVRKNYYDLVEFLIEKGAYIDACNGYSLRYSIKRCHYDITELLIAKGANIRSLNNYALRTAVITGDLDLTMLLIEKGANINSVNNYALRMAAKKQYFEIIEYLIEVGVDVKIAIIHDPSLRDVLLKYIREKELYKGPINEQTELECGICLTEMNVTENVYQCRTCKKCSHKKCTDVWGKNCIYCRN